MGMHIESTTVHTIVIDLSDDVIGKIDPDADEVRVVLRSRARNRQMAPIRLSYTTIQRLTRDHS